MNQSQDNPPPRRPRELEVILKQLQLFCLPAKKAALKAAGNMSDFKGKYIGVSLARIQHYVGK